MSDLNESMLNFLFYEEPFRSRDKIHRRDAEKQKSSKKKT